MYAVDGNRICTVPEFAQCLDMRQKDHWFVDSLQKSTRRNEILDSLNSDVIECLNV